MSRISTTKMLRKLEYQEKVNPGHKSDYVPEFRGRATVFKSKKTYNRQVEKKNIQKLYNEL